MIDVQVVIPVAPDGVINGHLATWCERHAPHYRTWIDGRGRNNLPVIRNDLSGEFLRACALPWLWMIDSDMVPLAETRSILCASDALARSCSGPRRGSRDPAHHGGLWCACLLIHRQALAACGPAPFGTATLADGQCECLAISATCEAAEIPTSQSGTIGHRFPCIAVPDRNVTSRLLTDDEFTRLPDGWS